jgi:hypothetical protein
MMLFYGTIEVRVLFFPSLNSFAGYCFSFFLVSAVHHRATGCPDEYPRMLIRTTVIDNDIPREYRIVKSSFLSSLEEHRFLTSASEVSLSPISALFSS